MFSMCRVAGRSQARIAVLLSGALLASACSQRPTITATDQLGGKEFAVPTGSVADALVKSKFPDARFKYFNTVLDAAMAVKTGKADAAAYDEPILRNIAGKNPGLAVLAAPITVDEYGFAVRLGDDALKDAIDGVVSEARADGLYQQMMDRWLPKQGSPGRMPELAAPDTSAGVLRFGTASVTEPFSFVDGSQKVVGLDVEIAARVAQRLNRKLEEIVLPEVHFDAVPLAEVVKRLSEDARKFDPEQRGVNFLINDVAPQVPLLDAAGNPVPGAQRAPLSEGLVHLGYYRPEIFVVRWHERAGRRQAARRRASSPSGTFRRSSWALTSTSISSESMSTIVPMPVRVKPPRKKK